MNPLERAEAEAEEAVNAATDKADRAGAAEALARRNAGPGPVPISVLKAGTATREARAELHAARRALAVARAARE